MQAKSARALVHLNKDYVSVVSDEVNVTEVNPSGAGTARFGVSANAIRIRAHRQGPLVWSLAERKCADGAFLTFRKREVHLHLVELKGTVSVADWAGVLRQFAGMFFAALAVARILHIPSLSSVTCYIALKKESVSGASSTAPGLLKTLVGAKGTIGGVEQWQAGKIDLPHGYSARLVKGVRDSHGDADFGTVA